MNTAPTLDFWRTLLGWMALEAVVLVAVAALLARGGRRATTRSAFWQVAVVGLIGLAGVELAGIGPVRLPRPVERPRPVAVVPLQPRVAASETKRPMAEVVEFPKLEVPLPVPDPVVIPAPPASQPATHRWPLVLWLSGAAAVLLARFCARLYLAWQGRRFATLESADLSRRVEALRRALGVSRRLQVCTDSRLRGPVAYGIARPTIVVPRDLADRFSETQQAAMLAHEMAHLAGRDPLWEALADVAVALWWWHPAAWWARRQLRVQSELAADEASSLVENGPTALAETLVILGRELSGPRTIRALGVEGGGFRSDLARRVTRLLSAAETGTPVGQATGRRRWLDRVLAGAVVLLVVIGPWPWTQARGIRPSLTELAKGTLRPLWSFSGVAAAANVSPEDPDLATARFLLLEGDLLKARVHLDTLLAAKPDRNDARVLRARLDRVDPVRVPGETVNGFNTGQLGMRAASVDVSAFKTSGLATVGLYVRRLMGAAVVGNSPLQDLEGLNVTFAGNDGTNPSRAYLQGASPKELDPSAIAVLPRPELWPRPTFLAVLDSILSGAMSDVPMIHWIDDSGIHIGLPSFAPPRSLRDPRNVLRVGVLELAKGPDRSYVATRPEGDVWNEKTPGAERRQTAPASRQVGAGGRGSILGRVSISNSLDQLVIPSFEVVGTRTLGDVIDALATEVARVDPAGKGVNFLLNQPPTISPATGIEEKPKPIHIGPVPRLVNIRVLDVLNAIVATAESPVRYTVEDYAVVFQPVDPEAPLPLYTRRYKTHPKSFLEGVESVIGFPLPPGEKGAAAGSTNRPPSSVQLLVRNFFMACGVDFPIPTAAATNAPAGQPQTGFPPADQKALFYNDRTGILFVRASLEDLDVIETAIQALTPTPIRARDLRTARQQYLDAVAELNSLRGKYGPKHPRIIEQTQKVRELQMQYTVWRAAFEQGGAEPAEQAGESRNGSRELAGNRSVDAGTTASEPPPPPPPGPPASVRMRIQFAEVSETDSAALGLDWLFGEATAKVTPTESRRPERDLPGAGSANAGNIRLDTAVSSGESVSLRRDQAEALLTKLRSLSGVDLLTAPELTTAPNQEGQVAVQQVQTVVTGIATNRPAGGTNAYETDTIPTGVTVSVSPNWLGSGWELTAKGRVTEFVGYDDPGPAAAGKRPVGTTQPLPRLRVREVVARGDVRSGGSLLVRGPLSQVYQVRKEGRLFKKSVEVVKRQRLLMIVTPLE